jgi:hypothetical protein
VVGELQPGDFRGMDVPLADHYLERGQHGGADPALREWTPVMVADPRSLARVMRRGCTEEELWDRLVTEITAPPERDVMVDRFWDMYRAMELVGVG